MKNEITNKERELLRIIRNHLVHHGKPPSYREMCDLMTYKSIRSITKLVNSLKKKDYLGTGQNRMIKLLKSQPDTENSTVNVPILGTAPCGSPTYAEENIEGYINVSQKIINSSAKHFLVRASGTSMNLAGIQDEDLVLVKQSCVANNGDLVVAVIDGEVTIKEFQKNKSFITLKPNSDDKSHNPIILKDDFMIQGIVQSVLPITI